MKYIRTYENIKEVQVGDFVQIKTNNKYSGFYNPQKIIDTVNNTVGQISSKEGNLDIIVKYKIKYANDDLQLRFQKKDIVEIGKTKEDVEAKLAANKYNL